MRNCGVGRKERYRLVVHGRIDALPRASMRSLSARRRSFTVRQTVGTWDDAGCWQASDAAKGFAMA